MSSTSPETARWECQRSFDELGRPLHGVTFTVVDLETTGGSAEAGSMITEIGAVKVRAGEVLGEFQTLVNPHTEIPPFIAVLTGISNSMVSEAPPIDSALPAFLEFAAGTVLVAHNAPFDVGFLRHFSEKQGRAWPAFEVVDTAKLARRVITRDDAPNCKLSSLAQVFHSTTTPNHRALSDARATVDVLHGLMERLGNLGVSTLEELQTFSSRVSTAQRRKRHLAEGLPHAPGVYLFRDDAGRVLYVGTSRDLRTRVRSYFTASETRSRMGEMVGIATSVTGIVCATALEAQVRELRLIAQHKPRYNRRSRFPEKVHFVKLTREPWPRLSLVKKVLDDDADYLGPFGSRQVAEHCLAALHETFPVRQCTDRFGKHPSRTACVLAEMGKCLSPVRRQRRRDDVRVGGAGPARHAGAPARRGGRGDQLPDGGSGRGPALRGGRRPPRPAGGVRAGQLPHPAPVLADPVLPAGRRPPRRRRPLAGARRPLRAARRGRGDPPRRRRPAVRRRARRLRRDGAARASARSARPPPRSPRRSCAGSRSPVSVWSTSRASGAARSRVPAGTSPSTTPSSSPAGRSSRSRTGATSRRWRDRPIALARLGPVITAIVFVKADVARIPEVAEAIAALDGVSEVYSVTGQIDLIALVRVKRPRAGREHRRRPPQQGPRRHLHRDPHRLPHLLPPRPRSGLLPRSRMTRSRAPRLIGQED